MSVTKFLGEWWRCEGCTGTPHACIYIIPNMRARNNRQNSKNKQIISCYKVVKNEKEGKTKSEHTKKEKEKEKRQKKEHSTKPKVPKA